MAQRGDAASEFQHEDAKDTKFTKKIHHGDTEARRMKKKRRGSADSGDFERGWGESRLPPARSGVEVWGMVPPPR
jgi:hypothetical protein